LVSLAEAGGGLVDGSLAAGAALVGTGPGGASAAARLPIASASSRTGIKRFFVGGVLAAVKAMAHLRGKHSNRKEGKGLVLMERFQLYD
jgi:hypothetical protein